MGLPGGGDNGTSHVYSAAVPAPELRTQLFTLHPAQSSHYVSGYYIESCLAQSLFLFVCCLLFFGLVWFLTKQQYLTVFGNVLRIEKKCSCACTWAKDAAFYTTSCTVFSLCVRLLYRELFGPVPISFCLLSFVFWSGLVSYKTAISYCIWQCSQNWKKVSKAENFIFLRITFAI